ncbi:MAG TPA: hypothetical protein VFB36_07320 [Nevskiaceae bacterium]|nr:hypothetical protein [Nevskiaceae bacterium]
MSSRLALVLPLFAALTACVTEEGPPPRNPGEPMTSRHLNTSMECSEWQRNADGSWTAVKDVVIAAPNGPAPVASGTSFRQGSYYEGVDVAYALRQECAH